MADIDVKVRYACGCGFKTDYHDEACNHVEKTGHAITGISGHIRRKKTK